MIIYYAVFLENHSYECIAGIISPCSSAGALLVV